MTTTKDAPNLQLDFVEIVSPRLWMSTTYKNTYVGNTAPAAALNVLAPLSGWYDCGTITAAKLPITKTMREVKRGLPQTSRKMWEIDRTAQITFNTSDLSPYVEALIMGQTLRVTTTGSSWQVASLMAQTKIQTVLASTPTLAQYDVVVCASPKLASLNVSFNLAVVESMVASLLTLEGGGFPVAMVHADRIKQVTRTAFIGRRGIQTIRSAMLFWDSMVDSSGNIKAQHCVYFPKIRNYTGGDFDFKSETEEYETGITLAAQAVLMTFDDGSSGYDFYKKWVLSY